MRIVVIVVAVLFGCGPSWHPVKDQAGSLFDRPWTWTDDAAQTVRFSQWRGTPLVVTAIYTSCDQTCPMTLMRLREVYDRYQREHRRAEFVVVTIDPKVDTVERLHAFRAKQQLPTPWHLLRGELDQTEQMGNLLGVHPMDMEQHVMHEAQISIFDEAGVRTETLDVPSGA
jgi:protein SCO1/2